MADIESLIQAGESETVEFKETWRDSDALRELAVFANTRGGTLLVGVADDSSVVGWHGTGGNLDALTNKIADGLRLHPTLMRVETVQGENVLRIEVAPSTVPISYRGRYFQRVGRTAREVPPDELPRFLMQRTSITWDALPAGMPLDAVSQVHLSRFIRSANTRLPQANASEDPAQLLGKLDLLTDDDPTRAAVLLFGEKPQALVFAAHVRMGRFKDDITIVDEATIKGTLFEQLDAVMQRFRQYLQVRYEIPTEAGEREGLEMARRREVWEYPLEALREAVVNALVHRDYMALGNIEIRVYDDQVIISNPGSLPEGMTLEELKKPLHASVQRNPLLAQTFYYAGLVERWGTGTARLIHACLQHGLPEPAFEVSPQRFTILFRKDVFAEDHLRKMGLTARQIQLFKYASESGSIDNATARQLTGVSESTALRDLRGMEEQGLLQRTGPTGRETRYVLSSNPPNPS